MMTSNRLIFLLTQDQLSTSADFNNLATLSKWNELTWCMAVVSSTAAGWRRSVLVVSPSLLWRRPRPHLAALPALTARPLGLIRLFLLLAIVCRLRFRIHPLFCTVVETRRQESVPAYREEERWVRAERRVSAGKTPRGSGKRMCVKSTRGAVQKAVISGAESRLRLDPMVLVVNSFTR